MKSVLPQSTVATTSRRGVTQWRQTTVSCWFLERMQMMPTAMPKAKAWVGREPRLPAAAPTNGPTSRPRKRSSSQTQTMVAVRGPKLTQEWVSRRMTKRPLKLEAAMKHNLSLREMGHPQESTRMPQKTLVCRKMRARRFHPRKRSNNQTQTTAAVTGPKLTRKKMLKTQANLPLLQLKLLAHGQMRTLVHKKMRKLGHKKMLRMLGHKKMRTVAQKEMRMLAHKVRMLVRWMLVMRMRVRKKVRMLAGRKVRTPAHTKMLRMLAHKKVGMLVMRMLVMWMPTRRKVRVAIRLMQLFRK